MAEIGGNRQRSNDGLGIGPLIAAIGGIALFGFLFLEWYSAHGVGLSAWKAFAVNDILLSCAAAIALSPTVFALTQRTPALPAAANTLTAIVGAVSTILILIRLFNTPHSATVESGAYLGLAAAVVIFVGGWLSLRSEPEHSSSTSENLGEVRPSPPAQQ